MAQAKVWMWRNTSRARAGRPSARPRYSREAARAPGENTKNHALIPGSTIPVANQPAWRSSHIINRTSHPAPALRRVATTPSRREHPAQHRAARDAMQVNSDPAGRIRAGLHRPPPSRQNRRGELGG